MSDENGVVFIVVGVEKKKEKWRLEFQLKGEVFSVLELVLGL